MCIYVCYNKYSYCSFWGFIWIFPVVSDTSYGWPLLTSSLVPLLAILMFSFSIVGHVRECKCCHQSVRSKSQPKKDDARQLKGNKRAFVSLNGRGHSAGREPKQHARPLTSQRYWECSSLAFSYLTRTICRWACEHLSLNIVFVR